MNLRITIEQPARALDRFEALWNRLAEGEALPEARIVSFQDLPSLLGALTPARWELLRQLRQLGPVSVYALARALQRNYKNVHSDVARFLELGLIEKTGDDRVCVEWELVRADFRLGADDQTQPAFRNR